MLLGKHFCSHETVIPPNEKLRGPFSGNLQVTMIVDSESSVF